jgi:hypothetical protein
MTRKYWILLAVAVLLGGFSLYLNTDWFEKDNIQIVHRSRPPRGRFFGRKRAEDAAINPIVFQFDRKLKLTELKVIPLNELRTNKYAHPIWHLVTESNSVPVKEMFYGIPIKGMHPAVKNATPDPLEPDVPYRLLIEAGPQKAEHDFTPVRREP